MKAIYLFLAVFFFVGCGYSTSQRDLVVSPSGTTVNESGRCVGLDCGNGYSPGYGAAYGPWGMGPASYQGLAPSWGRLGMIEAYRAQNRWVRSPGGAIFGEARDERLDRLVPHLRRMASAMCQNGTLTGDDCAPPERMRRPEDQSESRAPTTSTPSTVTGNATGSAASQGVSQTPVVTPPDSNNVQEDVPHPRSDAPPPLVRFNPRLTADELR